MIPIDVLQSVYYIQYGNSSASCFTYKCDQKEYLVTARHLFYSDVEIARSPGRKIYDISYGQFEIFQNNKWKSIKGEVYFHENIWVDIAVIELHKTVLPFTSLSINSGSVNFGQEVYFLGFPLGLKTWLQYSTSPYPLPLVKKAIIAGINIHKNGESVLYLDAQTNSGFSGGPIIFKMPEDEKFQICGIMTGGFHTWAHNKTEHINLSYTEDSGITIVTHISHLEEILNRIKSNKS